MTVAFLAVDWVSMATVLVDARAAGCGGRPGRLDVAGVRSGGYDLLFASNESSWPLYFFSVDSTSTFEFVITAETALSRIL